MQKKELIAIIIFLLLIVLLGFLYFNNYNGITGAVTADVEEKEPEFYGTYSIKPSFKVNVDYDLEEYNIIVENTKILFEECSKNYNLEDCVNNKIKEFNNEEDNLTWSLDCNNEEEKFFYDFVENYKQCFDSSEEGICEFSLANGPPGVFLIRLSSMDNKIKIELVDKNHLIELEGISKLYVVDKINPDGKVNKVPQDVIDIFIFFGEDSKANTKIRVKDESGKKIDFETGNLISLYKDKENSETFISFIDKSVYSSFKASKETFSIAKDVFKFCVKSDKQFYIYNENSKKIELKNIEYKFALKFIDKIAPPAIENIEIKDKLKDEDSVLILFDKSYANDIKKYIIYYSETDFKDQEIINEEIKDPITNENMNKVEALENEKIEIEDIDLEICEFKEENKPCNYDKYNQPLEKHKLYYLKKEEKYLYVLGNLKDSIDYNFMVVAVDYSSNLINNKDQKFILKNNKLPSGISIDDLEPGLIDFEKESTEKGKITLSWNREANNLDGSMANDITSFNIYYKEMSAEEIKPTDIIGKTFSKSALFKINDKPLSVEETNCKSIVELKCQYTISSKIQSEKIYLLGITALDEANNEYDYVFVKPFGIP